MKKFGEWENTRLRKGERTEREMQVRLNQDICVFASLGLEVSYGRGEGQLRRG